MRKVIQKIILIGISVSILLGSLSNVTAADHEQKNILNENLSNLITQPNTDIDFINIVKNERIVQPTIDKNDNKISDDFENILFNQTNDSMMNDVIVALDHAPNQIDILTFEEYGGIVIETWDTLVYALHGKIPKRNILDYSSTDGIVLIEKNENVTLCLDYSIKQIGVRPTVWNSYGVMGDSNHAIAIIDDGIDDSHSDLSGKIVKWIDFTSDGYTSPSDKGEHGTHCAGIAVGTGIASGTGTKKYTWSGYLGLYYNPPRTTYVTPTKSGSLSLTLKWDDDWNDGSGQALIWIDKNQNEVKDSGEYTIGNLPLSYSASINPGRYMVGVNANDLAASVEDFFCQINVPSLTLGDGHNLLTGVAPNCKLAGLKIFTDSGQGSESDSINALNWLATNAPSYNIIVASMSYGGPHSDSEDTAVNNLVSTGVVCVVAAGNEQGTSYVGSPGTAVKAITVGAVNDENILTDYSSIGDPGSTPIKPDVLAPGGSFNTGDLIISVDSNDADETQEQDPDSYSNDYRAMPGTSMACPHVAGIAALIADALGTWQYTAERALKVKQIICMTSFEIESAENPSYTPPFNHGGKDNKEGYGRVCADAAIEAATMQFNNSQNTFSFGNQACDKKVWARQVDLQAEETYTFSLNVPPTGNYDLYLYDKSPDSNGEPLLLGSSYNSGSANELVTYYCLDTGTYYIIAKWRSGSGQASVTCQAENEPPVANNDYYTVAEDTTLTVVAPGVLTNDTDGDNDPLTAIKLTNPSHGSITSFNSNGAFVYVPTSNYYGTDSFTYKVYDGTVYSNIATVYISVTSVNDTPVVSDIPNQMIAEGLTFTTINLDNYVSDVDNTDAEMTWTYSGNSQLTVSIVARVATITIPSVDWYGAETITFKATDPSSLWDDDAATFTVTAVNDPPVVSGIPDQTIAEGSTFTTINLDNYVSDVDNTDAQMTWTYSGNSQLTVGIVARVATITIPNVDWYGAETITFRATDPGSLWSQDAAVFTVTAVNDAPVVGDIPSQTIAEGSTFTTINLDNYVSDVDNTDAQMTWTYSGNVQLTVSIVNRVATISIPNVNWYGAETITFRATDPQALWDDDSAVFTVTSVNDVPVVNFTYSPVNPTVDDNVSFNDSSIDVDGTIISWYWDFGDGTTSTLRNTTHQFHDNITFTVTLNVTDNDGANSSITKQVVTRIIYTNTTQANTTTLIDLQDETELIITINTTVIVEINVSKYSGNPTEENITGDITAIGTFISIEADNESAIRWPINISIFYTQDDLNNSNLNESQLLGIYFWNDTAEEWELYNNTGVNASYNQSGYEGYCWANAWHLTILVPGGDNETPSKVTGLTVTDAKDGKLNLAWNNATDNIAVDHYKIYRDNVFVINRTMPPYQDTGLTNGHLYAYNVSAVDSSGNEGIKSDSVSGTPTASGGGGGGGGGGGDSGGMPPAGPQNKKPVANTSAGEPYQGFVNSEILFDGSRSHDPDGNITKWFWVFGDNTNGSGKTVPHIYSKAGTYTVTLTVTDNEGATNTDTTTCVITQPNRPPTKPIITGPTNGTKNTLYTYTALSTDADNDTIQYTFDWGEPVSQSSGFLPNGTSFTVNHSWTTAGRYSVTVTVTDNQTESSSNIIVYIDAVQTGEIGYLLDNNGDGTYDVFYSDDLGQTLTIQKKDGSYTIDSDGDGDWDYTFDATNGLTSYPPSKTPGIEPVFLISAIIVAIICAIIVTVLLWKKKRIV